LASKIAVTAAGFEASAPRPYTVSVGSSTRPPAASARAASRTRGVSISAWP
jgi:hypothetical protein